MDRIVIATSIAPRGLEKQRAAVESWRALGFEVMSLNRQDEIAALRAEFPDIRFSEVRRTAEKETGRPLVYFDDVLEALGGCDSEVVGIVNSDVMLRGSRAIHDFMAREASDAFLFGSRLDTVTYEEESARVYDEGFDFFFFDRGIAGRYPRSEFCLGMPWWDYWAPLMAHMRGVTVKRLTTPIAFHPHHETAWADGQWLRYANRFARLLHLQIQSATTERRMDGAMSETDRWLGLGGGIAYESYLSGAANLALVEKRLAQPNDDLTPKARALLIARRDLVIAWYGTMATYVNRVLRQHAVPVAIDAVAEREDAAGV